MPGSAGTLNVTVGASTGALEQGMKRGEDVVRRFSRTAQQEAAAVERSSSRISGAFGLSSEKMGRSLGTAAGGLLMLAGSAEGAAGTIGGTLARSFGALAAGGPAALGVTLLGEGIGLIGRRSREAAAEAERLRAVAARAAEEERASAVARAKAHADYVGNLRRELDLLQQGVVSERTRREEAQRARVRAAGDADFAAGRGLTGTTAASIARSINVVEDQRAGIRALYDQLKINDDAATKRMEDARRLGDIESDRKIALRQGVEDLVAQSKATAEQRAHWAEIQRIAEMRRLGMRDDAALAQRALDATLRREEAEKRAAASKQEEEAFQRRAAEVQARMDREAIAAKQKQLDLAEEAVRIQLDAQAQQSEAYKRFVQAQDDAARKRQERDQNYASGRGPLSMARDAKRAARNIARFQRHEDNLSAEARDRLGYGTISDGGPDPFAFDLGSIYARQAKAKPVYPYLPPGLLSPPPPDPAAGFDFFGAAGGAGGGSSVSRGRVTTEGNANPIIDGRVGAALQSAADAGTKAGADLSSAAEDVTAGADGMRLALEDIAKSGLAIGDGVVSIAEALATLRSDFDTLATRVSDAALIGG